MVATYDMNSEMTRAEVLSWMGVPKLFRNLHVRSDVEQDRMANLVFTGAFNHNRSQIVSGPIGSGKSVAVLKAILQADIYHEYAYRTCSWFPWNELVSIFRHMHEKDTPEGKRARHNYKVSRRAKALVIDDLWSSEISDTLSQRIKQFLLERVDNDSPVICTSNWKFEELGTRIGERLYDRYRDADYHILNRQSLRGNKELEL